MIIVISAFDGPWKMLYVCVCVRASVCVCISVSVSVSVFVFMYIRIYTISYTLMAVNISFFHRLMSFKVQSCVNLNGTYRKEDRTQQEKKSFTDQKRFEVIACK